LTVRMARVGDLAEQIRGVSFDKGEATATPKSGHVPVLRAGNISETGLLLDRDLIFVPEKRVSVKQRLQPDDVVIAASSGSLDVVGKAGQLKEPFDGTFGAFCKVLRPGPSVDPRYFAHFFRTTEYRRRVTRLAAGANINNLKQEHLDELLMPFPPVDEQRRIADVLDRVDELRTKRRAAQEKLEDLKRSGFFEMFGNPVRQTDGLPLKPLNDLLEDARSGFACGEDVPDGVFQIRMNNVTSGGRLDFGKKRRVPANTREIDSYWLREGDVLFNATNSPELVGKTAVWRDEAEPAVFSNHFLRLRPLAGQANGTYVAMCLQIQFEMGRFRLMTNQWVNQATVPREALLSMRIKVPPIDQQNAYSDLVVRINRVQQWERVSTDEITSLFGALQHAAFAGES